MNQKTPPAAAAFMVGTVVVAVLVGLWGCLNAGLPPGELPAFAVLAALGALANLYPIRAAQTNVAVYVLTNTFLFAGVLLLSSGWLALLPVVIWVPNAINRFRNRKPDWLLVAAANAGQVLVISVATHLLLEGWNQDGLIGHGHIAALLAVIACFVFYQAAWVATVVHLARGVPFFATELWSRDSLIGDAILLCLGAVVAVLWRVNPFLLLLIMVPVVFAYHTLRGVQLIRLGEVDGKTGLYNARRFEEQFQHELRVAGMLRRPLSLVFLDLDFLRDVNNQYGHLAGDAVIKEVARRIQDSVRQHDFVARFGGEEFVLLLPGTEVVEARWLAEKVRHAVAATPIEIGEGRKIHCSISGGVAAFPAHGRTVPQLTGAADAALYQAKGLGRNRTCTADEMRPEQVGQPRPAAKRHFAGASPACSETPAPCAAAPATGPAPGAARGASRQPEPGGGTPARKEAAPEPAAAGKQGGAGNGGIRWPLVFLAVAALLASALFRQTYSGTPLLLTLCVLGFMAEYFKVELLSHGQRSGSISLGVAVTMAAAVTLGLYAAVVVNVINFGAYLLQAGRRRWPVQLANLLILIVSAAAGSLPVELAHDRSTGFDIWFIGAVLAGGLLYFVINAGLVSLLVSRTRSEPLSQLWRQHYGWMAPSFIFTAICGGLMGSMYLSMGWLAFPVFALPLLIVRYTYVTHMRRSREAFEAAERGRLALEEANRLQTQSMGQLIELVSTVIDARDASVSGHSVQVARYATAIAQEMDLPAAELAVIRQAALLHDLGKMAIPEAILHKPGKLSPEEWAIMQTHARIGASILQRVPGLAHVARMVGEHHEKYNGKGYPGGLCGDEIALGARIIALADALDSMLSDRPYARAKPLPWALDEIERCSGEHFDPLVVSAFMRVVARSSPDFFVNSAELGDVGPWLEVAAAAMEA